MAEVKEDIVAPHTAEVDDLSKSVSGSDLDDNYALYQQQAGEALDPVEAKRVLRKVDLRVMPVLFVVYLLQYLVSEEGFIAAMSISLPPLDVRNTG
jgi:hypothetical protein